MNNNRKLLLAELEEAQRCIGHALLRAESVDVPHLKQCISFAVQDLKAARRAIEHDLKFNCSNDAE